MITTTGGKTLEELKMENKYKCQDCGAAINETFECLDCKDSGSKSSDSMSELKLIEAVQHMRDMQKLYIKTRDKDALKRSIIAEKIVDKLLE